MKIIGNTTFRGLFITFMLTLSGMTVNAQSPTKLTDEEQSRIDNHVRLTRQEYIHKWAPRALENREIYGIPASITLGQAILESGYGNSALSILTNNHFNIKCKHDWEGPTRYWKDDLPDDCFRVYESIEASYIDHGEYLNSRSWYEPLFAYELTDYESWARGLKAAGYATSKTYDVDLIRVINETHIYLLDQEDGLARYNEYLVSTLGATPITAESQDAQDDKGDGGETSTQTAAQRDGDERDSLHDHMARAYADNGIDPNMYRVTINSHCGYSVYLTNGTHYIVTKEGDTYASIAKLFELSEAMLRRYNDVDNSATLKRGDVVYVERKSARWQNSDLLHKVVKGETLHIISQIYGIRLNQLSKMNRIRPNDPLSEGQTIRLR